MIIPNPSKSISTIKKTIASAPFGGSAPASESVSTFPASAIPAAYSTAANSRSPLKNPIHRRAAEHAEEDAEQTNTFATDEHRFTQIKQHEACGFICVHPLHLWRNLLHFPPLPLRPPRLCG